jgi:hypothetical protein
MGASPSAPGAGTSGGEIRHRGSSLRALLDALRTRLFEATDPLIWNQHVHDITNVLILRTPLRHQIAAPARSEVERFHSQAVVLDRIDAAPRGLDGGPSVQQRSPQQPRRPSTSHGYTRSWRFPRPASPTDARSSAPTVFTARYIDIRAHSRALESPAELWRDATTRSAPTP